MDKVVDLADYKGRRSKRTPTTPTEKLPQRKVRKGGRMFLGLCLLVLAVFLLSRSPLFAIKTITVTGLHVVDEAKILELAEVETGENLFSLPERKIINRLMLYPFVTEAKLDKQLPSTLVIEITERPPVGIIVTDASFIQVGVDGTLLQVQANLGNYKLPIITGVALQDIPSPGEKIHNDQFTKALAIISSCDPELLNVIAELNVEKEDYILAYTNQGVEIRIGSMDNIETRMRELNEILKQIVAGRLSSTSIGYIDMRFNGVPVIKMNTSE